MDINALRNFLVIADEENITKAANRLNISQPPLSRQLKNLENSLGVSLFTRSKQRIKLTEEGKYLQDTAKQILALIDKTTTQLLEMSQKTTGTLYIGATETNSLSILPNCTGAFKKLYPNVNYNIRGGNSEYVIDALSNNLLDVGIVLEPYDTELFEGFRIFNGCWIAVINNAHPLAAISADTIEMEHLLHADLLLSVRKASQSAVMNYFEKENMTPHVLCEFSLLLSGIVMVQHNMGIAILPSTSAEILQCYPEITYKKIVHPEFSFHVSMIRRKNSHPSPIGNLFYDFIKQTYAHDLGRESDAPSAK